MHRILLVIGFFPIQILIFRMLRNNADARRCSYFELGLVLGPVLLSTIKSDFVTSSCQNYYKGKKLQIADI